MKKIVLLLFILIGQQLIACDFCGCFMGITPYDNQSSISLLYRYKSFNGYNYSGQQHQLFPKNSAVITQGNTNTIGLRHGGNTPQPVISPKTQRDYEVYTTAELRAKYFVHSRLEVSGILPLIMNRSRVNELHENVSGIGDINVFAAWHLISRTMTEKFQHRLILGGGVKLPVGNYYAKNASEERIDFMLQPGTGSVDYPVYLNYIFGYKKLGVNFNSTYKFNGDNYYHERICNSTSNYLNLFYKFRADKDLKLFPSIQGYYEYSKGLCISDVYQPGTTMEVFAAGIGLDLFYKNIALNTSFQVPVYEKKFAENMAMAGKLMLGLTYSFNQKKHLLHSKKS